MAVTAAVIGVKFAVWRSVTDSSVNHFFEYVYWHDKIINLTSRIVKILMSQANIGIANSNLWKVTVKLFLSSMVA
jgi:hypothetical protein